MAKRKKTPPNKSKSAEDGKNVPERPLRQRTRSGSSLDGATAPVQKSKKKKKQDESLESKRQNEPKTAKKGGRKHDVTDEIKAPRTMPGAKIIAGARRNVKKGKGKKSKTGNDKSVKNTKLKAKSNRQLLTPSPPPVLTEEEKKEKLNVLLKSAKRQADSEEIKTESNTTGSPYPLLHTIEPSKRLPGKQAVYNKRKRLIATGEMAEIQMNADLRRKKRKSEKHAWKDSIFVRSETASKEGDVEDVLVAHCSVKDAEEIQEELKEENVVNQDESKDPVKESENSDHQTQESVVTQKKKKKSKRNKKGKDVSNKNLQEATSTRKDAPDCSVDSLVSMDRLTIEDGNDESIADGSPVVSNIDQSMECDENSHDEGRPPTFKQIMKERIISRTRNTVLIKIQKSLVLCGKVRVQAIKGTVQVLGYDIEPNGEIYPLFSPTTNALLTISVTDTQGLYTNQLSLLDKDNVEAASSQDFAIVRLWHLSSPKCDTVTSVPPNTNIFEGPGFYIREVDVKIRSEEHEAHAVGKDHKNAADAICQHIKEGAAPVIMLCAGKNLGKSTYCRYLINKILCKSGKKEIAYLECDPGQTEFTPSCMLALHIITRPLLGPPFSHEGWPHKVLFFGDNNAGGNPGCYMHCLNQLHSAYQSLPKKLPLIVNTMGWQKGLGLSLFVDTLRMVRATHIVQIMHGAVSRNFPLMTQERCLTLQGWLSGEDKPSSHELLVIESKVSLDLLQKKTTFRPMDHRNLAFFAYFSYPSLHSVRPYEVPWSAVVVLPIQMELPPAQILYALNASVVALCVLDQSEIPKTNVEGAPRLLQTTRYVTPPCLGLGVIRAIDPNKKVFYVVTPVPQEKLVDVNCFMKGTLSIPQQSLFQQKLLESIPGFIPYVAAMNSSIGANPVTKRRHIQRDKR